MDEEGIARMNTFTLEPFVGPLPVRFGMTSAEVQALLGPPERIMQIFNGDRGENREHINIGYSGVTGRVNETIVLPGSELFFRGQDLYSLPDPIAYLRHFDPDPQLFVGFVIFPLLGISLAGFHDNDDSQKAINMMSREYMEQFRKKFVPYH